MAAADIPFAPGLTAAAGGQFLYAVSLYVATPDGTTTDGTPGDPTT